MKTCQPANAGWFFCRALRSPGASFLVVNRAVLLKGLSFKPGRPRRDSFLRPKAHPTYFRFARFRGGRRGRFFAGHWTSPGCLFYFVAEGCSSEEAAFLPGRPRRGSFLRPKFQYAISALPRKARSRFARSAGPLGLGRIGNLAAGNAPLQTTAQAPSLYLPPFRPAENAERPRSSSGAVVSNRLVEL